MNIEQRAIRNFTLMQSFFWAFFAAYTGYITTWMLQCGLTNNALSLMLAGYMLASLLGSIFWGVLCDKKRENKRIFLLECSIAVVLALLIFSISKRDISFAALLYPCFGFVMLPLGSNLDAWMLRSFHQDGSTYGKVRSCGSVGYAITMLIGGFLIHQFGYEAIPVMTCIMAGGVMIVGSITAEAPFTTIQVKEKAKVSELFRYKGFMMLLVIILLGGLASSPVYNLKIVILRSVGGDVGILGIDSFLGVIAQAAVIYSADKIRRINTSKRLFLINLMELLGMILIACAQNPIMIVLGDMLYCMSYGIMITTQREITEATVPDTMKTTAHALCDSTHSSLSGMIALLYSGRMMDALGARSVAVLGAVYMSIAVGISLFQNKKSSVS